MSVIFAIITILGMALISATTVNAQSAVTGSDMTVSPAMTEWDAKPGQVQTKVIKLLNNQQYPIPLRVKSDIFMVKEAVANQDRPIFDASGWFSTVDPYFILKPKEARDIPITLHVPQGASPGGHYATIYFQQFVPATGSQQTMVTGQVGSLAFVTVRGTISRQLTIDGGIGMVRRPDGAIDVSLTIRNDGNVHLQPTGGFVVRDIWGKSVALLSMPRGIVLPHTARVYTVTWGSPPALGYATVTAEVNYGGKDGRLLPQPYGFFIVPNLLFMIPIIFIGLVVWLIICARRRLALAFRTLFAKDIT